MRAAEPVGTSTQVLPGLQVLRAVAALMVVLHHAELSLVLGFDLPRTHALLVGSAGVDVFFVISGFIMLVSSRRLVGQPGGGTTFLKRRLIRIVPLYWAVTTIYVLAVLLVPQALHRTVSYGSMLASYLFWPHLNHDGTMHPALVVGWTLNYEMFFYVLFALAVTLPRKTAVRAVIGGLAATVVLAGVAGHAFPPLAFWGEPIVLEFAAGIVLGLAYERGIRVPRWLAAAAIVAVVAAFAWQIGRPIPGSWPRLLVFGLPSLILVGAVVLAAPSASSRPLPRALVFLGDASYSLYLVHFLALTATRLIAKRLGFMPTSILEEALFIAASTAAAIVAAIVSYLVFERPVTRWLRARFDRPA